MSQGPSAGGLLGLAPTCRSRCDSTGSGVSRTGRGLVKFWDTAAIQWCQGLTAGNGLVVFDRRLREAGYAEGFTVFPDGL